MPVAEVERELDQLTEDKKTKLDQIERQEKEIQQRAERAADRYKEQLKETEEEQKAFNQAIKDTLESAEKVFPIFPRVPFGLAAVESLFFLTKTTAGYVKK